MVAVSLRAPLLPPSILSLSEFSVLTAGEDPIKLHNEYRAAHPGTPPLKEDSSLEVSPKWFHLISSHCSGPQQP
jgi:hypothetical protein